MTKKTLESIGLLNQQKASQWKSWQNRMRYQKEIYDMDRIGLDLPDNARMRANVANLLIWIRLLTFSQILSNLLSSWVK